MGGREGVGVVTVFGGGGGGGVRRGVGGVVAVCYTLRVLGIPPRPRYRSMHSVCKVRAVTVVFLVCVFFRFFLLLLCFLFCFRMGGGGWGCGSIGRVC